jgi:putative methyltransferase (TIGR04325 family)
VSGKAYVIDQSRIVDFMLKFLTFIIQLKKRVKKFIRFIEYGKIFKTTYDDVSLTTNIIKNTLEYSAFLSKENLIPISSLRTALPFALGEVQHCITVLDFGGGAGTTYFEAKYFFPNKDFRWIILETKTMANIAQSLNSTSDELEFISDFGDLQNTKIDFVIANGSLQYTDNPIDHLNKLINLNAKYLYITRMPLAKNSSIKIQQISRLGDNGPQSDGKSVDQTQISIEATIVSRSEFEDTLARFYQVKHRFLKEKNSFHGSGESFDFLDIFV